MGALCKAGGPPVPSSSHWVAGLALTFLASQCAGQQQLPGREFFMLELLREMWTSPGSLYHPRAWQEGSCLGKGMVCLGIVFSQRELVMKPFFSLCCWLLLLLLLFFKIYFSPPQHICTEWEIKAAVNNVLAHRKVLEHTPSSCTASTWKNYWESFKIEFSVVVCRYEPLCLAQSWIQCAQRAATS